jgi:hypothetical protein
MDSHMTQTVEDLKTYVLKSQNELSQATLT